MKNNVMKYDLIYYEVINFVYDEKDFITKKVIDYYKNYVFMNKSNKKRRSLDKIMNVYISDDNFRKYVCNHIEEFYTDEYGIDYYYDMNITLSKLFADYLKYKESKITTCAWL